MITSFIETNIISIITVFASVVYFVSKIDSNSKAQKTFFETELKHVSNILALNHENLKAEIERLREDIVVLQNKQNEQNLIRERVGILESSVRSAHHRIDRLESIPFDEDDE